MAQVQQQPQQHHPYDNASGSDSTSESSSSEQEPQAKGPLGAAPAYIRRGFVRKVYSILGGQLLLTAAIAAPFSRQLHFVRANPSLFFLAFAITLITTCAMVCCQSITRTFPQNYIILFLFTAAEGVMIGFVCASYTGESLALAVGVTALIFLGMTAYAWNTKTDFTGFGPYLFAALLALTTLSFVLFILSLCGVSFPWLVMLYDLCGVLLFTFYIVFDTQLIIGEWGGHGLQFSVDDYVFAAMNLYLDIIQLFLHILRLFGERR
mmetsp:Transcript_91905/g.297398  ORF Transcript_91905/g.297398 Transcript_91905/m.297398 type:complete len:265 (-) Transcript_91905:114-908(-)